MALEPDEAIEVVRYVERAGGDYVMASPPYPPGETEKMLDWYRAVAHATDISIMAYDCVYGPWGEERLSSEEVIVPLASELENLTATKTTDPPNSVRILKENTDLSVLCGWTAMMLLHYQYGADGMLVGNPAIMPKENVAFDRAMRDGDIEAGRDIFYRQIVPVLNWFGMPYAASALKQVFVWRGFYANSDVRSPFEPLPEDRARELLVACKRVGTL
jgi:dihydrodipicolinate synthase/N-acetylneuraminate lyase